MRDFTVWLSAQTERDDNVGDLAEDAARDEAWPEGEWLPHAAFHSHVERHGEHVIDALAAAWAEWMKEEVMLGDALSFVYFIRATESKRVKIGLAKDPRSRLKELQTGCPEPLELLLAVPGHRADESALHRANAADAVTGEWFQWSEQIAAQIEASSRMLRPVAMTLGGDSPLASTKRVEHLALIEHDFGKVADGLRSGNLDSMSVVELKFRVLNLLEDLEVANE